MRPEHGNVELDPLAYQHGWPNTGDRARRSSQFHDWTGVRDSGAHRSDAVTRSRDAASAIYRQKRGCSPAPPLETPSGCSPAKYETDAALRPDSFARLGLAQ